MSIGFAQIESRVRWTVGDRKTASRPSPGVWRKKRSPSRWLRQAISSISKIAAFCALLFLCLDADAADRAPKKAGKNSAETLQRRARARMRNLDFEPALKILDQALSTADVPPPLKASILADAGICRANLGDWEGAKEHFNTAIRLFPAITLPAQVSPKIEAIFIAEKNLLQKPKEVSSAAEAPTAPQLQQSSDNGATDVPKKESLALLPPDTAAQQENAALSQTRNPEPLGVSPAKPSRSWTLPAIAGGVAIVSLGVGVTAALISKQAHDDLSAGPDSPATADRLLSKQNTWRAVSIGCYAIAGISAGTGIAIAVWPSSPPQSKTPDGLALSIKGAW